MQKQNKISVIGAGNVGEHVAADLVNQELGEIVLLDIEKDMPKGKALDMRQRSYVTGKNIRISGTDDYADIANSDIVVITAGFARQPGMSRDDLLKKNTSIVAEASQNTAKYSPESTVIVVTNPLDTMCYAAAAVNQFQRQKVIGMAGILDSTRFPYNIAKKLDVSPENIVAMVLGGHGDEMIPLSQYASVGGIPMTQLLDKEDIAEIEEKTRYGGGEIVKLLKKGSAYHAPAASIVEMVDAMVKDKRKVLPCSVYLDGEYGAKGVFMGVPIVLGQNGIEKIVDVELNTEQKKAFQDNVEKAKKNIEIAKGELVKGNYMADYNGGKR